MRGKPEKKKQQRAWVERLEVRRLFSAGSPFGGTATAAPGVVQAENYDLGGEGVGYHDFSAVNEGGQYRTDGVGIETTTDVGGGFDVGHVQAGEWMNYTVNVASAGSYTLQTRVASLTGGTFHYSLDGATLTTPITLPNTGGWQNWQTVNSAAVNLPAGPHVLQLFIDSAAVAGQDVGNFNSFQVVSNAAPSTSSPFTGTPYAVPGVIQADNYDLGGQGVAYHTLTTTNQGGKYRTDQVSIESTTDAQVGSDPGGPFNVGNVTPGEWLNYTVNVATAGAYVIGTRVASLTGGAFHYNLDGATLSGSITLPNTGGWQTWQTVNSAPLTLTAGTHVLQLFVDSAAVAGQNVGNFHYITLAQQTTATGSTPFTGTPYSLPGTVQIDDYDLGGQGVAYHTLTTTNQGGKYRTDGVSIEPTTDAPATADPGAPFDVGHVQPGEWLNYTVNIAAAASYVIQTRVASQTGGTFHYTLDGVTLTNPITLPKTGGWQTWQTVSSTPVNIPAGTHVLQLLVDTAAVAGQDVGNFHYFTLVNPALPSVTVAATAPGANELTALNGTYTITRTGPTTNPLAVTYSIGGTAVSGTDFTPLGTTVTIPAGSASTTLNVAPVNDHANDGPETVVLTLIPGTAFSVGAPGSGTVTINDGAETAFAGRPLAVPGYIEAENFDNGGEGVAYHVPSPVSNSLYRNTAVNVQLSGDTAGGFAVNSAAAGEWLKYTVDAAVAGTYTITTRLASGGTGGSYHIEVDGANVTGSLSVGNTGGGGSWTNAVATGVHLTQGVHVLKLSFDKANTTGGTIANVNWIRLDASTGIPAQPTWKALPAVPLPRLEAMAATVNGKFYVFGGFINAALTATTEADMYNSTTNAWSKVAPLPSPLTHAAVAVDGQFIYISGGETGNSDGNVTNAVWKYDTVANAYTSMPSLPLDRGGGGSGIVGRTLYFFGGLVDGFQLDGNGEAWKINLDTPAGGWTPIANMPDPRNHMGGVALGGKVYAIGGQHNRDEGGQPQSEVDAYDPATNTWTTVASLPFAMGHIAGTTFVFQNRIVIAAGETFGKTPLGAVLTYNPATNEWNEPAITPAARKSPTSGFIGNQIIFSTGASTGGVDATATAWLSSPITLL